jgi:PKD repeat protein
MVFMSLGLAAQIAGIVVNSSNQTPIANHTVYVAGDSLSGVYSTTITNTSGQYLFPNLGSSSNYDVFLYDCNKQVIIKTVTNNTAIVNFFICVGGGGCQAAFTATPDPNVQGKYSFTDQSTGNPSSWSWDFGDGNTSTQQNCSHAYAASGTYTITLYISSPNCSDSTSQQLTVNIGGGGCQPAFITTPAPNVQGKYSFTDQSTGNLSSWSWDFGDGSTSTQQNCSHTYAASGSYTVTLHISGPSCSDSTFQMLTVNVNTTNCTADFSYSPSSSNPLTVNFTDKSTGSPTSWNWTFGDGATSSAKNPVHTYAKAGSYTVTLSISGNNCQSQKTDTVIVITSSIEINNYGTQIKTYPNPVDNILNININAEKSEPVRVAIYNLQGQQILSKTYMLQSGKQNLKIDLGNFIQGTYLLNISSSSSLLVNKLINKAK